VAEPALDELRAAVRRYFREELNLGAPELHLGDDDEPDRRGLVELPRAAVLVRSLRGGRVAVPYEEITRDNLRSVGAIVAYVRRRFVGGAPDQ